MELGGRGRELGDETRGWSGVQGQPGLYRRTLSQKHINLLEMDLI